jgi:hypothetical protein
MFDDGKFNKHGHAATAASPVDVALSFPRPGVIRVRSNALFAEPDKADWRKPRPTFCRSLR